MRQIITYIYLITLKKLLPVRQQKGGLPVLAVCEQKSPVGDGSLRHSYLVLVLWSHQVSNESVQLY